MMHYQQADELDKPGGYVPLLRFYPGGVVHCSAGHILAVTLPFD